MLEGESSDNVFFSRAQPKVPLVVKRRNITNECIKSSRRFFRLGTKPSNIPDDREQTFAPYCRDIKHDAGIFFHLEDALILAEFGDDIVDTSDVGWQSGAPLPRNCLRSNKRRLHVGYRPSPARMVMGSILPFSGNSIQTRKCWRQRRQIRYTMEEQDGHRFLDARCNYVGNYTNICVYLSDPH